MSQFIETIKVLNGKLLKLSLHQARFERTREEELGLRTHPDLSDIISVPDWSRQGVYKCRILYAYEITQVKFSSYHKPLIQSLKLVKSDCISYAYKSADRSKLEALYAKRDSCDDILIVKNGFITDSYFANVILWDGSQWVTPEKPLLKGCMRFSLLASGRITEKAIHIDELSRYKHLRLINALNDIADRLEVSVDKISW